MIEMSDLPQRNRSRRTVWDVLLAAPTYSGTESLNWPCEKCLLLDSDIWVGRYDGAVNKIMDACEPAGYWRGNEAGGYRWQPTRQFGAYYAIVCTNPSRPDELEWDPDRRILRTIALSRLVHPTAIGLEYAARLKFDEVGLKGVYPFPAERAYTVSNQPQGQQRHWLKEEEWSKVSELLKGWPNSKAKSPPRISRALRYFEKTAYEYHFADRWELLIRTAEVLWGSDWTEKDKLPGKRQQGGRSERFKNGLRRLAGEFELDVSEESAKRAWDLRSRVTHGIGLPQPPDREDPKVVVASDESDTVGVYLKIEEVLRKTLQCAIQDDAFAARFESESSLDDWLSNRRRA